MYQFRQIERREVIDGTSALMLPPSNRREEAIRSGSFGDYMAAFRGALVRLFGEPRTPAGDAYYSYLIEATPESGASWILTVYHGPSGPRIGGNSRDTSVYPVAQALQTLIESTPPLDFEVTTYAEEYNMTITYGCHEGKCYWNEARGRKRYVTQQEHTEREMREKQALEKHVEACEAEDRCYICDGRGYFGKKTEQNICPECRGSGKLSSWQ